MYKVKTYANPLYRTNVNEAITYDFYNEQDVFLAGFHGFTACRPLQRNHKLDLFVQWYDNSFCSEDGLALNAEIYRFIRLRLKNGSRLTNSRIDFITEDDGQWSEDKSVTFTMRPCDELYATYTVDMGANPRWSGRIRQVRFRPLDYAFDPGRKFGDMGVLLSYDYIQFAAEDLNPGAMAFTFQYDAEGFTCANGRMRVHEYLLHGEAEAGGFYLESPPGLRLSTANHRYLRIRQRTTGGALQGAVAYTTAEDRTFDQDKRLPYRLTGGDGFVEYTVDLTGLDAELWQIRIYPLGQEAGACAIDYLVFDTVETADIRLDAAGEIVCDRADACLEATGFQADAAYLKYVKVRLSNATVSRNALLQWITEEDPVYDERKSQRFVIHAMDGTSRAYTVGLGQNQYWRGIVTGLRLLPAADTPQGAARVESLTICRDGDTLSQNREIVEGFLELGNEGFITGWDFERDGGDVLGYVSVDCDWVRAGNIENDPNRRAGSFTLVSEGNGKRTAVTKEVTRQTEGVVDWSFAFQTDTPSAGGMTFRLMNGGENAVVFETKNGALCTGGREIAALRPADWYEVRAFLDLDAGRYTVAVNGFAAAGDFPLGLRAFDTIQVFTPGYAAARLTASTRLYKVGHVFEDYYSYPDMPVSETVRVAAKRLIADNTESRGAVDYRLDFAREARGLVDYETVFLVQDESTDAALELLAGEDTAAALLIGDGCFSCRDADGERIVLWERFKPRVWYAAVVTVNTVLGTADYRINGQVRARGVRLPGGWTALTACRLTADEGKPVHMEIRQTRVKPRIKSTVPYIDKVSSRTGLVGMQAWFLLSGFWMRVQKQFEISDKTPYLGYYDDMNVENVDWQVKFLAEHGVDFIAPFFYSGLGAPAYSSYNLLTTFLKYSEHHEQMKFCITMGEIFETMTQDKMLDNVLPFFIENYFKHPSYLLVDNKPVLMLYSWETMMQHMTAPGVRAMFDAMRERLKEEGFDGLIILGEERPSLAGDLQRGLEGHIACGLDRLFAYCNIYTERAAREYVRQTEEAGLKGVCSLGCGWDNRYWAPPGGYFIVNDTPAEFEAGMRWMAERPPTDDPLDGMVLLDNWSEFGEGHSISPSNLYGFGYLNAIRKVFTDADERHYDTVPEGAFNALNINGTELRYRERDVVFYSRWPMPRDYEAAHNILHSGGYAAPDGG